MKKSVLRSPGSWVPIERSEAARLGLTVEPFAPVYHPDEFGLVLDRSVWFEARIPPRWIVALRLANQRGQPVIAELRIFPDEPGEKTHNRVPGRWRGEYGAPANVPPGGLTARILRTIRTQAFRADLLAITTRWTKELKDLFPVAVTLTVPPSVTPGRKGRSDIELARIAAIYETAYLSGRPAIAAVAKAFGLSLTKSRDAVRRARVRGLLSPASKQGKGGGLLTPLAQEILKQNLKSKGGKQHGTKR